MENINSNLCPYRYLHITKAHWDDEDGYDDLDDGEFKKEEDEEGDEDEDRLYACGFRTQILLGSDYFLVLDHHICRSSFSWKNVLRSRELDTLNIFDS